MTSWDAVIPLSAATGLRDFTRLREAQDIQFASTITLTAIGAPGHAYRFSLGDSLVSVTPRDEFFCYAFRQTEHLSIESALTKAPLLAPAEVTESDKAPPAPTWQAAKKRAAQIAAAWPEARLGVIAIRYQESAFLTYECSFRGMDLKLLGKRLICNEAMP